MSLKRRNETNQPMNNLNRSIVKIVFLFSAVNALSQDINFSSEYNKMSWPVALGLSGGITGDDGNYKRLALYHGGSISLQTGSNSPGISNSRLFINSAGQVGVGTTSPQANLHIEGPSGLQQKLAINNPCVGCAGGLIDIAMGSGNSSYATGIRGYVPAGQPGIDRVFLGLYTTTYNGGLQSRIERLTISDVGNVGIGNNNPDAKLTVTGQVHAQEVKVTVAAPGPDYVFEKDYKLTSLEEIKNYIDQNKHLPEVPSAKEMEKNGIQLGEMNMLLLKKIEELTLYVIEQQKQIEILKQVINK
jgi:hypothetical protein